MIDFKGKFYLFRCTWKRRRSELLAIDRETILYFQQTIDEENFLCKFNAEQNQRSSIPFRVENFILYIFVCYANGLKQMLLTCLLKMFL